MFLEFFRGLAQCENWRRALDASQRMMQIDLAVVPFLRQAARNDEQINKSLDNLFRFTNHPTIQPSNYPTTAILLVPRNNTNSITNTTAAYFATSATPVK